jgi:anti-anti-sigma regulatory factor
VTANRAPSLKVTTASTVDGITVLTIRGVLDGTTYLSLRNEVITAALAEPVAVVVDVTQLDVPTESAFAVFTSARWHVVRWPEIPIVLVCEHPQGRDAIARNGIARYVPVYPAVDTAITAIAAARHPQHRRRARADLPANTTSLRRSRDLVAEWLTAWSLTELIPVTKVVVTALVENVLMHTNSRPNVRLETDGTTVTVAVADASHVPASPREVARVNLPLSGLRIVGSLCRMWGNTPTPDGKTVWAVIGPENRL